MTNIILLGDLNDGSISNALVPALERYGGVKYVSQACIYENTASPGFFLCDCERMPELKFESGIIIFKNSVTEQNNIYIPDNFINIMETKNERAAAMLQSINATALTCGCGPKDTLSIAGLENSSAALSLQRNLRTLSGDIIEPRDFNVKFSVKRSPHQILSVCAALLASGVDSSQGYSI